jgi:hypothetical protein
MFTNTNLERFNSSLNNLITGDSMFSGCKLNAESIFFIVDSLPKHDDYVTEEVIINEESGEEETIRTYNHNLTIGVGFSDNQSNKQLISDECLFSSWDELNNSLIDKGWNITWQFNN